MFHLLIANLSAFSLPLVKNHLFNLHFILFSPQTSGITVGILTMQEMQSHAVSVEKKKECAPQVLDHVGIDVCDSCLLPFCGCPYWLASSQNASLLTPQNDHNNRLCFPLGRQEQLNPLVHVWSPSVVPNVAQACSCQSAFTLKYVTAFFFLNTLKLSSDMFAILTMSCGEVQGQSAPHSQRNKPSISAFQATLPPCAARVIGSQ